MPGILKGMWRVKKGDGVPIKNCILVLLRNSLFDFGGYEA